MEKKFNINAAGHSIRSRIFFKDAKLVKKVVIFAHGFGGTKDTNSIARFADRVISKHKDAAVVAFDFPCHGEDGKKKLILADCMEYLELMIRNMKETYNTDELYMYATSFGGYLTLRYIHENGNPFRKIALRCPAICIYESLSGAVKRNGDFEKVMAGKDVLLGHERMIKITKDFLEDLQSHDISKEDFLDFADDILIMHGTADEMVPFETARDFAEENVIEFIAVEGADHRFRNPKQMDVAIQDIITFFDM